jgi:hypothetical protein
MAQGADGDGTVRAVHFIAARDSAGSECWRAVKFDLLHVRPLLERIASRVVDEPGEKLLRSRCCCVVPSSCAAPCSPDIQLR